MTFKMKTYPIAEMFYSIQGEGVWAGTPMYFVRLAGCTVGKYAHQQPAKVSVVADDLLKVIDKSHSICTTSTGSQFVCDTDYHSTQKLTAAEIIASFPPGCLRVCISGGEPFMHDLEELLEEIGAFGPLIHLETSGTIQPSDAVLEGIAHLCVSPKQGALPDMLAAADEIKLLVGQDTTLSQLEDFLTDEASCDQDCNHVYLQPINSINDVDQGMVQKCWEMLQAHPEWKLSSQLHKFVRMR